MRILTLSGWGQPPDALMHLMPQAEYFDYGGYSSFEDALQALGENKAGYDMVIGWSLGGQLALRATALRMLHTATLMLIAVPVQFVAHPGSYLGMKRDSYEKFHDNYVRNPERTLHKAWELVVKGDKQEDHIRAQLLRHDKQRILQQDWLRWLQLLERETVHDLDMTHVPPTVLIHGREDLVVGVEQSELLATRLPQARLLLWPECGHAPHWHNPAAVRVLIQEHIHV